MTWALYYSDGSVFTSLDGEPWESPEYGVVGILQSHYQGTKQLFGRWFAFYADEPGQTPRWWNHETETDVLCEASRDVRRFQALRRGKYADDTPFLQITTRMQADLSKVTR